MSRSTRLLFSGKKSFWKSRKVISIDILLIQHCPAQIIEVIACDAELKFEAPHLYVVEDVLLQKLDSSQLGPDRAIVDFIFDRIVVSSYAPEHDSFEVDITNTIGEATLEGLVVARPRGLVPYTSPFAHSCRIVSAASVEALARIPKSPRRISSGAGLAMDSPRAEQRGIAENDSQFVPEDLICATPSHLGGSDHILNDTRLALPSTDVEVAHGAPPRPLYGQNRSPSSPQNTTGTGMLFNPRVVPRRSPRSPDSNHSQSAKAGFASATLIPAAPTRRASASAPTSPYPSRSPSPQQSSPRPILRALSSTISTLGLGNLFGNAGAAGDGGGDCSDDEDGIIGLSLDTDKPQGAGETCNTQLLTTGSGKVVTVAGTPPLLPRSIVNTESSVHLAATTASASKRSMRQQGRQRRHTYDPAVAQLPHATSTHFVSNVSTATAESPRTRLLGMRDALDSLRFPWSATVAGGTSKSKSSKVSPSVSMQALDQLELETRPFEP